MSDRQLPSGIEFFDDPFPTAERTPIEAVDLLTNTQEWARHCGATILSGGWIPPDDGTLIAELLAGAP